MLIVTRQRYWLSPFHLSLTLENTRIEQAHEHRVLGVTTDDEIAGSSQ